MAKQIINIGSSVNDKHGDPIRTAFSKVNDNFTELYTAMGADVQIPAQTGNNGKYLTTNGTTLSWGTVSGGSSTGSVRFNNTTVYTAGGGNLIFNPGNDSNNKIVVPGPGNGGTFPLSLTNTEGDVTLTANSHTWTFDSTGILNLPQNTDVGAAVIQPNAGTFGVKLISNGNTFAFGTDGSLTIPNAIRSAAGQWYAASSDTSTEVSWTGNGGENVPVYSGISSNNAGTVISTATTDIYSNYIYKNWTFGMDGTLKVPGTIWAQASDNGSIVFSNNGTDDHGSLKVDGGYNMVTSASSNYYVKRAGQDRLAITDTTSTLMAGTDLVLKSNKNSTEKVWTLGADGRTIFPTATVPTHSYGATGDKVGMVAFDGNYIYYCKQDYVNNSTNIWVRVAWTGTTW